jgi:hypothetical protein
LSWGVFALTVFFRFLRFSESYDGRRAGEIRNITKKYARNLASDIGMLAIIAGT